MLAANRINKIPILSLNRENIHSFFDSRMEIISDDNVIENVIHSNDSISFNANFKYLSSDTQVVIFTSGSTGNPKAVELTFNNIFTSTKKWNEEIHFNKNDVYLNMLSIDHIGGLSIFFRALYYNFTMVLSSFSNKNFYKLVDKEKITLISLVPAMLYQILNDEIDKNVFDIIRYVILGGSMMDLDLIKRACVFGVPLYLSYGMTETSSGVAGVKVNVNNVDSYSYKAFSGVNIIVDKSKIIIKSSTLMKGYWGSILNRNEYFVTSDLGFVNDNQLIVTGRSDDVIISGGENFSSSYIENKICKLKEIDFCKIVGEYDPKWGQKITAYIKINNKFKDVSKIDLVKIMRSKMNRKIIPKNFHIINDTTQHAF